MNNKKTVYKIENGMNIIIYMNDGSVYYGKVLSTEITIVQNILDGWISIVQPNNDSISTEEYSNGTFGLKDINKIIIEN